MDLNIGSAFYFASRGAGHVLEYSALAIQQLLATRNRSNALGRPLVRRGEEEGRQSIGVANAERAQMRQMRRNAAESAESSPAVHLPCTNPLCKRMRKVGCAQRVCKRCCDHQHSSSVLDAWKATYRRQRRHTDEQQVLALDEAAFPFPSNPCSVHGGGKAAVRGKTRLNLERMFSRWMLLPDNEADRSADSLPLEEIVVCDSGTQVDDAVDERPPDACDLSSLSEALLSDAQSDPSLPRVPYATPCLALIVGNGADEQLGGYARHRTAFQSGGLDALVLEMRKDLDRYLDYCAISIFLLNNCCVVNKSIGCGGVTWDETTAASRTAAKKPGFPSWMKTSCALSTPCPSTRFNFLVFNRRVARANLWCDDTC